MAIEISKKRKIKTPVWAIIFGIFSLILILILAGSYVYLNSAAKKITREVQEKEKSLAATSSEKALENNLNLIENRIKLFASLLSKHRKPGNIFTFIESVCLPNVQFSDFSFGIGQEAISLSGKTDSFLTLEQQLNVLKQEPLVKKIDLSNMSTDDKGIVSFALLLVLDPKIFK
jgi:hypothetical protein